MYSSTFLICSVEAVNSCIIAICSGEPTSICSINNKFAKPGVNLDVLISISYCQALNEASILINGMRPIR